MGKGRTKLPTSLKLRREAASNSRNPPAGTLGDPPEFLGEEARRFWRETAPLVEAAGLAGALDRPAFALLAAEYAACRERTGYRHSTLFLRLAQEFGLTPLSRSKLQVSAVPRDELADFLAIHT